MHSQLNIALVLAATGQGELVQQSGHQMLGLYFCWYLAMLEVWLTLLAKPFHSTFCQVQLHANATLLVLLTARSSISPMTPVGNTH